MFNSKLGNSSFSVAVHERELANFFHQHSPKIRGGNHFHLLTYLIMSSSSFSTVRRFFLPSVSHVRFSDFNQPTSNRPIQWTTAARAGGDSIPRLCKCQGDTATQASDRRRRRRRRRDWILNGCGGDGGDCCIPVLLSPIFINDDHLQLFFCSLARRQRTFFRSFSFLSGVSSFSSLSCSIFGEMFISPPTGDTCCPFSPPLFFSHHFQANYLPPLPFCAVPSAYPVQDV